MARDSLFGETILWQGRPRAVTLPRGYAVAAAVAAVVAVVAVAFAVVLRVGLGARPSGLLALSGWCSALAMGFWRLPLWWRAGVEYLVTDEHVIWRRGRLRRTIARDAISYARIKWSRSVEGVGDLILVRAVPTGALRRTLQLTLADVQGPDRVWAQVRDVFPSAALGDGHRPLTQRLDDGERVLWSGTPRGASPWTPRRITLAILGLALTLAAARMATAAVPALRRVLSSHTLGPAAGALLTGAMALAFALLVAVALGVGYAAWVRPRRLARHTRYLVTDRRVLIHRGDEELHLDRSRIAFVIDAPEGTPRRELHDVFLVLDGPQARAFSSSGAFAATGEGLGQGEGGVLRPVLHALEEGDAETVRALLAPRPLPVFPLSRAA